LNSGHHL
jgi:ribosome maturation protein SDO1